MSIDWAGEGALVFSDGETFQFKRPGFLHPEWSILNSTGRILLSLKPDLGWKKKETALEMEDIPPLSKRTSLLAIVFWYVIILISVYDYDGGGSAAAVMAASGM